MRFDVAIVGAGPAGLVLGRLLQNAGISSVILERRSREHVEKRVRAGVLEQGTVDLLSRIGVDQRLLHEGLRHEGVEWRFGGRAHRIPIAELTDGRAVTVYGQQELVKDLIAARVSAETPEPVVFDATDVSIHNLEMHELPRIRFMSAGEPREVVCDFIAGCDGFHGVCRQSVPAGAISSFEHTFPFAWLGILADVPPSTEEVIYCHHPRGFALHSMRSRTLSRLYVQCDPHDRIGDWSDDRVWTELHTRMSIGDDWTLAEGQILEKSITPMRSFVAEPMRYGRLFLAGDAAHVVPPTGAKGLNMAVADAATLGAALTAWYRTCSSSLLDAYSDTCLQRVWRVQEFTTRMTSLFHTSPDQDDFATRLQTMQLASICSSPSAAREFAESFVGLPLGTPLPATGVPLPTRPRRGREDRRPRTLRVVVGTSDSSSDLALAGSGASATA
jgi:p-hydroxybenzoate 3-monooxygenase